MVGAMHAALVRVTIHDPEPALKFLREEIVPRVSQSPGFVNGYWMRASEDKGWSVIVFESEDAAKGFVEQVRAQEGPGHATIDGIDIREVIAHA
jgi:hypothetical protein